MGMKVCKLVRLTKKDTDGKFTKGVEGQIIVRSKAVVSEETVAEFEGNFETSGLLYIVDKKATAKRDKDVEKEVLASRSGAGLPAPAATEEEEEEEDTEEEEEKPTL